MGTGSWVYLCELNVDSTPYPEGFPSFRIRAQAQEENYWLYITEAQKKAIKNAWPIIERLYQTVADASVIRGTRPIDNLTANLSRFLHMVKTANATWGHYGEMAGGQPWVYAAS